MKVFDDIERVSATLRRLAGGHEPRRGQIEAVESLAIYQEDTILVAATGYGKSAVLFAFSALKPNKITVQIVPLVTLGQSQREDIATKLPESRPIWIDADTHLKNKHVWKEVKDGKYTHVLLSPEQALNPKFKAILRDPAFHTKIGLFAIDELHCVGEWRHFREDYTYLYTLRSLLPASVPWFGCTATLDRDNQGYILKHAGFNSYPKIIRTSIDRPEISIVVQPLLRGSIRDYRRLQFLLEGSSAVNVREVPMTIIYLDNKTACLRARYALLQYLRRTCGFEKGFARKVVRRFDADVRPTDKEIIFKDFANVDTDCRIIVATVSLGMVMDIPDVKRVIQFGIPPSTTIADIWQRIRRAVRKQHVDGRVQGTAYLFIPYWAFDHLGSVEKQKPATRKRPQPKRSQRQPHAPTVSSRLQLMTLIDEDSDDARSQVSVATQASHDTAVSESRTQAVPEALTLEAAVDSQCLFDFKTKVKWTKQDVSQREKLDPVFMAFLNASCFRKYALQYLQEDFDNSDLEYRRPLGQGLCCNACNHELGKVSALPPREKRGNKPSTGSLAGHALGHISSWCAQNAQKLVPQRYRRFDITPEMFMDIKLQYAVARLFSAVRGPTKELPFQDLHGLTQKHPALREWEHFEAKGAELATFCITSLAKVKEEWEVRKAQRAREKDARAREAQASGVLAADASRKRAVEGGEQSPSSRRAIIL